MTTAIDHHMLRNSLMFKDLSDDLLQEIANRCRAAHLGAGETLFHQDDPADALYFLLSGQVHIIRHYENGDEVILATESPYYVIGELSLLADQPRTGMVVAASDCELVALDRQDILAFCEKHPDVTMQALSHFGYRLYRLNLRIRESAIGNVEARIAGLLLLLASDERGTEVTVQVMQLSRVTAVDVNVIQRLLRLWSERGLLSYDGTHLTIENAAALRTIAGQAESKV
jgi:CRP/FNR family cyclic AMP-dependent transcriptional regulator